MSFIMAFGITVPLLAAQSNSRNEDDPFFVRHDPITGENVGISLDGDEFEVDVVDWAGEEGMLRVISRLGYTVLTEQCVISNVMFGFDEDSAIAFNTREVTQYDGNFLVHFTSSGEMSAVSAETKENIDFDLELNTRELLRLASLQSLMAPYSFDINSTFYPNSIMSRYDDAIAEFNESNAISNTAMFSDNIINMPGNALDVLNFTPLNSDRQRVTNTTISPYRGIVHLDIMFPWGRATASGFLIRNDIVLTAGHNLFNPYMGGTATTVMISPGRSSESHRPFGRLLAHNWWIGGTWVSGLNPEQDYAIIQVDGRFNIPAPSNFIPVATDYIPMIGRQVNMTGFPGGLSPAYAMWRSSGQITGFYWRFPSQRVLTTNVFGTAGSSGSPLYNANREVFGIFTGPYRNQGAIRSVRLLGYLVDWMNWLMTQI